MAGSCKAQVKNQANTIIAMLNNLKSRLFSPNLITHLIVGLGNPGRDYRDNRHNIGFMVVDELSARFGIALTRVQSRSLVGMGICEGKRVILAKPQTYMNLSGQAVAGLVRFYKILLDQLLVIHDDMDLPFGTLRIRPSGGSGGQKGLASIIQELGTEAFPRMRLGIGRPPKGMDPAEYVLQSFSQTEQKILSIFLKNAVEAVETYLSYGLEMAMSRFNGNVLE
jgi:PTH1 family peptidyl-tRNA hydrolase